MIRILSIISLLFLISCGTKEFTSESDYYKFINNEKNGLTKKKTTNEFEITVKFLPTDYLVFKEVKDKIIDKKTIDSLEKIYSSSKSFLISINPLRKVDNNDALFYNAQNMEDYKERILMLNFHPEEYLRIETQNKVYYPVLSTMENVYNIDDKRSIVLVFTDDDKNCELYKDDLDFIFEDKIFDTGINHFVFKKEKIHNIPKFNILKLN